MTISKKGGNAVSISRMNKIVSIYQNRYPSLFSISMKETKDEVKFIYSATR